MRLKINFIEELIFFVNIKKYGFWYKLGKNLQKKRQLNNYPFDWVVSSVIKYIPKNKKNLAVELGCGAGNNLEFLSDQGYSKIIGVEGSKSAVQYAKKKIKKKNIEIIQSDFKEIFFENVDLFLDRGSLTHNKKKDINIVLSNIISQLNIGGFFYPQCFVKVTMYIKKKKQKIFFLKKWKLKMEWLQVFMMKKKLGVCLKTLV